MLKYWGLISAMAAIGIGLAIVGDRREVKSPEPDFEIMIEPLKNVFNDKPQQSLCVFDADFVTLYLRDKENIRRVDHDFCSAYQGADAKLVKDGRGRNYVFLEHGEGRGTNATTHFLSVFRIVDDHLRLVTKTELDWPTDIHARFGYSYSVRPSARGGLELVLQGKKDGRSEDPCCIPPEQRRIIRIDSF